jgi:hypothetical protein
MTVIAGEQRANPKPRLDEVDQLKRLIEIQREIVELAIQNELTEQECEALRHELSRAQRRPERRWSLLRFLRAAMQRVIKRA